MKGVICEALNYFEQTLSNYFQGIASGKLMVSHLWVEEAVNCGFIPDTTNFEVKDGEIGGSCGPQKSRIDKENGNLGLFSR